MFLPVRIVAVLSVCAVLAGCFQVETTVRVNPDGSGTVEEKMLLNGKMVEQMDQMAKAFSEPEEKAEPFSLYDPKKLRERAAGMGAGVSYVSGEPVEEKGFKGYRAIYSFKDINKLKLSQKSDGPMSETAPSKDGSEKPIQFRFTTGREARLVVIQPRAEKKPEQPVSEATQKPAKEERAAMTPDQEKAMEELLKGMKFSLAIEVNGTIRDSNATYRDGNRITVFEFNPGSMVMDAKKLELLKKAEPASPEEAKEILKALPGFKMELNDPLEVVFSR